MFSYQIGYWTCESSYYKILLHREKYTEEQIHEFVKNAIITILPYYSKHLSARTLEELILPVIEYLVDQNGFDILNPDVKWECFGWRDFTAEESFKMYEDDTSIDIAKAVQQEYENYGKDVINDEV